MPHPKAWWAPAAVVVVVSLLVASCGGGGRPLQVFTPTATPTPPTIDAQVGQLVYAQTGCAGCHGSRAGGGIGPPLADLRPSAIVQAVRSGPGRMPSYTRAQLVDEQLDQIVEFIEAVTAIDRPSR